jgi:hypothetical protein
MASPFSGDNSTRVVQTVGRIQRFLPNKEKAVVLDYTDDSQPINVLRTWADKRVDCFKRKFKNHETIR